MSLKRAQKCLLLAVYYISQYARFMTHQYHTPTLLKILFLKYNSFVSLIYFSDKTARKRKTESNMVYVEVPITISATGTGRDTAL